MDHKGMYYNKLLSQESFVDVCDGGATL